MNKRWVIWRGEIFEAVVFKEKFSYKKEVENPVPGVDYYIVHKHEERTLNYDEDHDVFYEKGRKSDLRMNIDALEGAREKAGSAR